MNHQVPQVPTLGQPPPTAHSRGLSSRSFRKPLTCPSHPPHAVSRNTGAGGTQVRAPNPQPVSADGDPKTPPPGAHPTLPLSERPRTPSRASPESALDRTPGGEPRLVYRDPAEPRPHLQPLSGVRRVTSSSSTESITAAEEAVALASVAATPPAPLAVATRSAPQVPAPSSPGLVRTLAAPLEFKPQPPPSFPALLPTETRRGHPGARGEASRPGPGSRQGSAGGRHLN